jgi:signal transduction histidine kinase
LEEANARLAILDRLKTDFLAFIAHELRTPLSNMIVLDLLDPNDDPQALAEMIELLRKGYERLEKFVEKGLEYFTWLAKDEHQSSTTLTDFVSVVRKAAPRYAVLQKDAPVVDYQVPSSPCWVRGETEHLARVVHILLDNALKFSEDRGPVHLRLENTDSAITLSVTDHGCGFPPEIGKELFRPFTIANVMNHTQGGGLHLALANAIVTAYGGEIRAFSAGPRQGATFTVALPAVSLL